MEKECEYCSFCSPENYWTTVDIEFLRMCENMYQTLEKLNPDLVAPGWIQKINEKMKESYETGEYRVINPSSPKTNNEE